ncbi:MAG: helix-turn-helix domain-containing protein [Devosia sp.]|uniref:helix-turn-helix domain-containing protein n=1 Tax=Devosia sp. TaxID=1871048 RepID=UPI003390D5A8
MTTARVRQYAREEAARFGCSASEILSPLRRWDVVAARRAVMRRLRDDGFSTPQIGKWLDRDHTTVLSGLRAA